MTAFPTVVQTQAGRVFHLTKEIGRGGEGAVYETRDQNDIALKIYFPTKAQSRRDKVSAMASAHWYKNHPFVAFPIDVLFSPNGAFVGFAMKKIGGHKPVHMLYSPANRKIKFHKANYKFLVRAASNISKAVASVHDATGCVIGDVNHSGFLVSDQATSVLIDSDSFQVVAGNNSFLCQVGTPEYTPPELQGSRFDHTKRTANHDNFGLAVLIFQLLFMGRHPFSGKFLGSAEMPLERAISEYRFAYSTQTTTKMERPPGAPMFSDFPPYIGQAFEGAFGRVGSQSRPSASDWISLLGRLENELEPCTADASHHHVKGKPCPWCRMEQANPGFVAFVSSQSATYIPTSVDVSQIKAIINAIRDPGSTPNLQAAISPTNLNAAAPSSVLISKLKTRAFGGIAASAAGAVLICFGGTAVWPGVLILGGGILCNVLIPPELKKLRQERSQANSSWRVVQDAWAQQSGNNKFLELRKVADDLIRSLADLPDEERRGIQLLEQKKKEAQLHRHLDRFLIAHARIRKIGSGRKAVLASFGIETAADIDRQRIASLQGFGVSLISELMAWRQTQVNKFVFNPNEPINPGDLSALKTKIATRRVNLDGRIRVTAANLQQESNVSLEQRRRILASANQAYAALKQAEFNEAAVTGPLHKASRFISLCCAVFAAVGLSLNSGPKKIAVDTARPVTFPSKPPETPSRPPSQGSTPSKSPDTMRTPSQPPNQSTPSPAPSPKAPAPWNQQPTPRPPTPSESAQTDPSTNSGSSQNPSSGSAGTRQAEAQSPPPLAPPQETPTVPGRNPDPPGLSEATKLDLSRSEDVVRIQQRLIALGYLAGSADGKWGPRSRAALLELKARENLSATDGWDLSVENALFRQSATPNSISPFPTSLPFVGGWTTTNGECGNPGELPPVRITSTRAETDGGACEFKSVRPEANNVWRVLAICSANRKSWTANIRLTVQGSELRWVSERPETVYYRCQTGAGFSSPR
jgi:DNA-binding helix-hairpin-helix protein with protein kinase domain